MRGSDVDPERDTERRHEQFAQTVAALADGELTFDPPFDIASAAALAANMDVGDIALALWSVTAQRDVHYTVQIHALVPGQPALEPREILDTTVSSTANLVALLEMFIDELHLKRNGD